MFKFILAKHRSSIAFLAVAVILCSQLVSAENDEDALVAPPPHCPYNCTLPYSPLCGSDGKTYGNICHLNTKNRCDHTRIRKIHDGTCRHQHCIPDPYPITCNCHSPRPTQCFSSSVPHRPVTCRRTFKPVCGTNGITYPNACQLAFNTACLGYPVRVCHKGPCSPGPFLADPVDESIDEPVDADE